MPNSLNLSGLQQAIARELGLARNTVRSWVRRGRDAPRPRTGRPSSLVGHEDWLRKGFLAGVRNADVLRQELAERGVQVHVRTVERFVDRPARDPREPSTLCREHSTIPLQPYGPEPKYKGRTWLS